MEITRTRFAPSPTGALHAGTVRTALFAWLQAKHDNGQFILRIEDTDQARNVEGAVENIIETLHFIGIDWEEGPNKPSKYGPYFQSQRLESYKKYGEELIAKGRAYADPYSQTELEDLRNKAKSEHKPFLFRNYRPVEPPKWDGTQPLRFKSDPKPYEWKDLVMGRMNSTVEAIDDFILIKSDGFPTYNFAHIIDDFEMKITHVLRSQEFISSMPKFLNLYEALEITPPKFAILPPVLNESGNKKLSKREGAKQIIEYKKMGIMPEALINFLSQLGWNDGTTQEIYNVDEIINKFDLSRVQKSGAQYNEDHLIYINGVFIRNLSIDELFIKVKDYWPSSAEKYDNNYKKEILKLVQERLKYFSELEFLTIFFFEDMPIDKSLIIGNKYLNQISNSELKNILIYTKDELSKISFDKDSITNTLNKLLFDNGQKPSVLFSLIRIATTQVPASPGLAESLNVLGKDRSINRINQMIDSLNED